MAASRSAAGAAAERLAASFLEEQYGYRILERNFHSRFGEVDIIAEEAGVICFVEVRSRTTSRYGEALETIRWEKRKRIALAARHYTITRNLEDRACRFDVVTIQNGGDPELLKDAFHLDD